MSTSGRSSPSARKPAREPGLPGPAGGLVGFEELTAAFERLITDGSLTHAYCLAGDRGIGKATFARALAERLEWGVFPKSIAGRGEPLLDCTTVSPTETGSIGIDPIRAARQFLWKTPFRSPRRTAIIDGAEALTPEAQGALLKIVEEPPPHALLVLVTYQPDLLLPPLRSRLSLAYVRRLSSAAIQQFLVDHHGYSLEKAVRAARVSFGSIGRALEVSGAAPEADPGSVIERALVEAHLRGFEGYAAGRLAWLAKRLELTRRYNLNPGLQGRAIGEYLR